MAGRARQAGQASERGRREAVQRGGGGTVSRRSIPLGGCAERPEGIPVGSFLQTGSGSCRGKVDRRQTDVRTDHEQGSGRLLLSEPALSCGAGAYPWLTQHPAQRPFAVALTNKIVNQRGVPKPIGELREAACVSPQHDLLRAEESGESDGRGRQTILGELAILSGMSRRECWLASGSSHDIGQQGIGA